MNENFTKPFKILKSWQYYLNEGNLSGILKLYDKNCLLIPTFSSEILKDQEQIKEYFIKVIEVQKGKVEFQPNSISEQKFGKNIYLISGKYFFNILDKEEIPARFSFILNHLSKNPIIHHHSSRSIHS